MNRIAGLILFLIAVIPSASLAEDRDFFDQVNDLWESRNDDAAHSLLDSMLPYALAAGDSAMVLRIHRAHGVIYGAVGRGREAELPMRKTLELAQALEDSVSLCVAYRWLGVSLLLQSREDEGCRMYDRLLETAVAIRDTNHMAWGYTGTGYCQDIRGDFEGAKASYGAAIPIFRDRSIPRGEVFVLNLQGLVHAKLGEYSKAYASYHRTAEIAEQTENLFMGGLAFNNLGSLDLDLGDPGQAMVQFEQAAALFEKGDFPRENLNTRLNLLRCQYLLGNYKAARDTAVVLQAVGQRAGYTDLHDMGRLLEASIRKASGEVEAAKLVWREILAGFPVLDGRSRFEAVTSLAAALADQDSLVQALEVLDRYREPLSARGSTEQQLRMAVQRGEYQVRLRVGEGIGEGLVAVADEADELGLVGIALQALPWAAEDARLRGDPDGSLQLLNRAGAVWLEERSMPLDPEWREVYGAQSRRIYSRLATQLLVHPIESPPEDRLRTAFDAVQVFKARTLLERMAGPGVAPEMLAAVNLRRLQREILEEGEIVLDYFLGPDRSLVFLVSRDTCLVQQLPSEIELGRKAKLYHEMLSSPDAEASPGLLEAVGVGLLEDLVGSSISHVESFPDLIISPDGALNLVPWSALIDGRRGWPRRLQRVPSATILAQIRGRTESGPPQHLDILALAGTREGDGHDLPGVRWELKQLEKFRGVRVQHRSDPEVLQDVLSEPDLLHFSAHATVLDDSPWRSAINLGQVGTEDQYPLRAMTIARMRLPARLTVLASCSTAGGRVLSGEGVQGLASSFLGAGVPTVLASLWAVDDAATALLMKKFYEALADGLSVAVALRQAQTELAENPRFAAPFYWAGFVIIGEGNQLVALEKPIRPLRWLALFALLVILGVGSRFLHLRFRS